MTRCNLLGALAMAATGLVPLASAVAQSGAASDDSRASITVTAPRVRQSGRGTSGAPIQTVTTQSIVYVDDLDLRSRSGRAELDMRIETAAREACAWLDEVYPMTNPATTMPQDCRADAVRKAQAQVKVAVARAGG